MIQIEPYQHHYLSDVFRLLRQLWPDRPMDIDNCKRILETGLKSTNQQYSCAILNNQAVGFCSLTFTNSLLVQGTLAYIDELVVDTQQRGKGIGYLLLAHAENLALAKGCQTIELYSAFHRNNAHAFYEHNKFEKTAYLFSKKLV